MKETIYIHTYILRALNFAAKIKLIFSHAETLKIRALKNFLRYTSFVNKTSITFRGQEKKTTGPWKNKRNFASLLLLNKWRFPVPLV